MLFYFSWQLLHGDYGLRSLIKIKEEVRATQLLLDSLRNQRIALEENISLLRPENIDPDMLEERARQLLNYSNSQDMIIMLDRKKN